ncbi:MAG: hypothetical protein H0X36_02585 [Sphingomonadaceae bacterium]|nr:hypothetical protein [Sphingomonadaceae bacterium]
MSGDITLVTHRALAEGFIDDRLLADALASSGHSSRFAVWDDPSVDWTLSSLTLIRSTWDYQLRPAQWFAWIDRVAAQTRLLNPAAALRWNSDKRYLSDLSGAGIAIVPTVFVKTRDDPDLAALCRREGWRDVVVKPAIGASAHGTRRFKDASIGQAGEAHLCALLAEGVALVQPFQGAVETELERSLVFLGPDFSHAFTKAAFSSGTAGDETPLQPYEASKQEIALGLAALAAIPIASAYARVDLVPAPEGPLLMELELVEPDLALRHDAGALRRFAKICLTELGGGDPAADAL